MIHALTICRSIALALIVAPSLRAKDGLSEPGFDQTPTAPPATSLPCEMAKPRQIECKLPNEPGPPSVEFIPQGPNLEIRVGGKHFTTYRVDAGPKPILYPLIGADGLVYSRSYPMEKKEGEDQDHPH